MSKSLRIVDFVRIACPVRGTTYPARAKQVFGGIARLMGTVGSHAGSLPFVCSTRSSTPNASPACERWSRPRR